LGSAGLTSRFTRLSTCWKAQTELHHGYAQLWTWHSYLLGVQGDMRRHCLPNLNRAASGCHLQQQQNDIRVDNVKHILLDRPAPVFFQPLSESMELRGGQVVHLALPRSQTCHTGLIFSPSLLRGGWNLDRGAHTWPTQFPRFGLLATVPHLDGFNNISPQISFLLRAWAGRGGQDTQPGLVPSGAQSRDGMSGWRRFFAEGGCHDILFCLLFYPPRFPESPFNSGNWTGGLEIQRRSFNWRTTSQFFGSVFCSISSLLSNDKTCHQLLAT
jgi:hypothetical protein